MTLFSTTTLKKATTGVGLAAATLLAAVTGVSCKQENKTFRAEACGVEGEEARWCGPRKFAGDIEVSIKDLNDGHDAYMIYCYACHGENGDGKGPASYSLRPPPRDFTRGSFKFARLRSSDDIPHDDDLVRIVHGGLHGTAMVPWDDIPDAELRKIIQYVKTFAPKKWEKKKKSGEMAKTLEPYDPPADPWASDVNGAVSRGRELYHFKAECVNCHPAYGGKEELYKLSVEAAKREPAVFSPITGFRDDVYGSAAKDSDEYKVRILPPDFTFSKVRSIRKGSEMEDLFRVISYGVYPIMPAWKDALTDKDIWAISHYVKSLMDIADKPEAAAMKARFASQAPFEIPVAKPAEEKPAEPAAEGDKKEGDKKEGDAKPEDKKADDKTHPADQKGPNTDEKKAPGKK